MCRGSRRVDGVCVEGVRGRWGMCRWGRGGRGSKG